MERLDAIFKSLEENPKGKTCKGMEGLISEGSEAIEEYENAVRDAALIGAAQRVEHYKIAAYGAVIAIALQLGETKRADTLDKTLKEEKETDARLTAISQTVNAKAEGQNDGEGISEPKATKKSSKHRAP